MATPKLERETIRGEFQYRLNDESSGIEALFRLEDGVLRTAHPAHARDAEGVIYADMWQFVDREEWNMEYGGLIEYDEIVGQINSYQRRGRRST